MQKGRLPTLNYARSRGLFVVLITVETISGARKNEECEDIQRLLAMAHNKEIDCVLVSELTS